MPAPRKRPCSICRHWFRPHPRIGVRQRACSQPECQAARRQKTQARWRAANPDYAAAYRIQRRSVQQRPPEPLRLPAPLSRLPWDLAKDQFGVQGADFLGVMGTLLLHSTKDQICRHLIDPTRVPGTLPAPAAKTSSGLPHTECRGDTAGHATGVSPTGAALGAPAGAPPGPAAAAAGLAG